MNYVLNKVKLYFIIMSLIISLSVFCLYPYILHASSDKTNPEENAPACQKKGVYKEKNHVCFNGLINQKTTSAVLSLLDNNKADLYLNTQGGDAKQAWKIGRKIFKDKHKLIIFEKCYAACASYLIPAASSRLEVRKNAVILLYGPLERLRTSRVVSAVKAQKIDFFNPENTAKIQKLFDDYPKYYQEFIVPESQYFVDIEKTDAFIVRYYETRRNIGLYSNTACHGPNVYNVYLVMGPDYLDEIGNIPVRHFWWPEDKSEIINQLGDIPNQVNLVFDTDLMPSWVAGKGFVKQSDCLALN